MSGQQNLKQIPKQTKSVVPTIKFKNDQTLQVFMGLGN